MSLSDMAALGSFVSGFAVLVSLVFLYFQLRQVGEQVMQTEKNQRALINQGYITRTIDLLKYQTEPSLNELRSRMDAGATDFTAAEIEQLAINLRCSLLNVQDAYVQHKSGLMDKITFDNSLGAMKMFMSQPINRALWIMTRASFAPELAAFVDTVNAELSLATRTDSPARLQSALSQVMS